MLNVSWKARAKRLKTDVHALYLALHDARVPWYAKVLMALVIGYALCPIDLIPEFIPVLGQIDDLIIVPAGISIVLKMIPPDIMGACRQKARQEPIDTKTKWIVASIIILIYVLALYLIVRFILHFL
jgi:uncharacterized membrane protein YkvA (DUF1232 family)